MITNPLTSGRTATTIRTHGYNTTNSKIYANTGGHYPHHHNSSHHHQQQNYHHQQHYHRNHTLQPQTIHPIIRDSKQMFLNRELPPIPGTGKRLHDSLPPAPPAPGTGTMDNHMNVWTIPAYNQLGSAYANITSTSDGNYYSVTNYGYTPSGNGSRPHSLTNNSSNSYKIDDMYDANHGAYATSTISTNFGRYDIFANESCIGSANAGSQPSIQRNTLNNMAKISNINNLNSNLTAGANNYSNNNNNTNNTNHINNNNNNKEPLNRFWEFHINSNGNGHDKCRSRRQVYCCMGSVVLALVLLIICVSALTFFMVNRNVNLWDESSSSSSTLSSTISPKLSPNIESEFLDNQQREERLEKGSKVILGEFILSNRHYSPALDSQSSQDFQSFASDVVKSMDEMFLESPLAKIYNLTQVYEFSESDTKVGLVVRCRILLNIELLTAAQEVGLTFINALERRHGRLPAGNLRVDITSIKFTGISAWIENWLYYQSVDNSLGTGSNSLTIGANNDDNILVHEINSLHDKVLDLKHTIEPLPLYSRHRHHQSYQFWLYTPKDYYNDTVRQLMSEPNIATNSRSKRWTMTVSSDNDTDVGASPMSSSGVSTLLTKFVDNIGGNKYSARDITDIKGMSAATNALSTASAAATSIASPTQMAGPVLHPLPPSFSGRPETTNVATDDVPPTNVYAISGGNANSDDDNSNNDGKGSPPESTKQTSGHDSMVVVDHNKPVPIVKPTVNNNNNGIVISGDGFPNKVPQSVVKMPIDITISVSGNTDGDSSDNNNNHEEKVPITSDNNGSGNDGVTAFWSNWSEWSPCRGLNGKCDSGRIHSRIRKCLAQSGEVVNSDVCRVIQREQQELEIRDCRCDQEQESHHFMVNTTNVTDSTHLLEKPDRACNDCKQDEICLLQVKAAVPFCAKIKDPRDPRGCGGWCSGHKELCRYVGAQTYQCVDDSECLDGEWQCANGLCIPESRRCDGHFNCFDMSDEMHCQCKEDEFHCGNKTSCLPLSQRCDGIIHCWDGEDEQNCTKLCSENQFTCNSGQCIPIEAFCDSHRHCTDGSDEPDGCNSTIGNNGGTNTCKSHEYQCRNGKCISRSQVCDGDNHCGDGSDERDCRPQLQQQQQRRKQQQLQQQQQQQHSSGISQTS